MKFTESIVLQRASRPATSFSNKFYKPGEENAAVIATTGTPGGMVNSTAMTK